MPVAPKTDIIILVISLLKENFSENIWIMKFYLEYNAQLFFKCVVNLSLIQQ